MFDNIKKQIFSPFENFLPRELIKKGFTFFIFIIRITPHKTVPKIIFWNSIVLLGS